MLIPLHQLVNHFKLNLRGVLHIGAHECEEQLSYIQQGIKNSNIYWLEAMDNKVAAMRRKLPDAKIYHCVVSDEDGEEVELKITNNGQSSSLLDLGTHLHHHPHVWVVGKKKYKTKRLDTFIEENKIPIEDLNFLNLDIQGVELKALKSLGNYTKNFDYIYTEVNTEYVYKGCALRDEIDSYLETHGFKRVACKMCGNFGWGDAFYMRSASLPSLDGQIK